MDQLPIKVDLSYTWEDGLGGKCAFCREPAWLRQLRLAAKLTVGGRLASEKDLCILCQACGAR